MGISTDEQSGFNNLPFRKRLELKTGHEWVKYKDNRGIDWYRPKDGSIKVKVSSRFGFRVYCGSHVLQCKTLKPLYPDIKNFVAEFAPVSDTTGEWKRRILERKEAASE